MNNTEYETLEELADATDADRRGCICPESANGEACLFVEDLGDFRLNESCLHCAAIDEYDACPGDLTMRRAYE